MVGDDDYYVCAVIFFEWEDFVDYAMCVSHAIKKHPRRYLLPTV